MTRVSIAIDNSLYYQFDSDNDDVLFQVVTIVKAIAGKLWDRAEWYTETSAGVIQWTDYCKQIRRV